MPQHAIPRPELQVIFCKKFPPFSLLQINNEEEPKKNNHEHTNEFDESAVELVISFNEPIPTRDYP